MFGNGVKTLGMTTTSVRLLMAGLGKAEESLTIKYYGEALGMATLGIAALRRVAEASKETGNFIMGSV